MYRTQNKWIPAMLISAFAAAIVSLALSATGDNVIVTALLAVLTALLAAIVYIFFRISSAAREDTSRRADAFLMPLDDAKDEEIVGKRPGNHTLLHN